MPRASTQIAKDLHTLLENSGEKPSLVLVGHMGLALDVTRLGRPAQNVANSTVLSFCILPVGAALQDEYRADHLVVADEG